MRPINLFFSLVLVVACSSSLAFGQYGNGSASFEPYTPLPSNAEATPANDGGFTQPYTPPGGFSQPYTPPGGFTTPYAPPSTSGGFTTPYTPPGGAAGTRPTNNGSSYPSYNAPNSTQPGTTNPSFVAQQPNSLVPNQNPTSSAQNPILNPGSGAARPSPSDSPLGGAISPRSTAPRSPTELSSGYLNSTLPPDYAFADMGYWVQPTKWEGSVEVGLNGSAGNSESLSIQSGFDLSLEEGDYKWTSDLNYVKTTTDTTETQHNALFNYGVKRGFGDSPWSLFGKSALEYDEFKAWDVRWSINGGFGYRVWKTDITELTTRFGAGASREFGGPDESWAMEAVFGLDFERQLTKRQKIKLTSDFFPEWQNFADYRVVTNFSWEFLLDAENNLSLKLDVTDRYDSTPNGRRPNDINYSLLLLWKT